MLVAKYDLSNNQEVRIFQDECGESPREWDNLSTMVCFHERYSLGDEHDYNSNDYSGWDEIKEQIEKDNDVAIILPLYMYDHSSCTISTTPFECRWDSGQIGWVFCTKEKVRDSFLVKRISEKVLKKALTCLLGEVEVYDQYLRGDVYGFQLVQYEECACCHTTQEEVIDSCWGFYGYDLTENGMLTHLGKDIAEQVEAQLQ